MPRFLLRRAASAPPRLAPLRWAGAVCGGSCGLSSGHCGRAGGRAAPARSLGTLNLICRMACTPHARSSGPCVHPPPQSRSACRCTAPPCSYARRRPGACGACGTTRRPTPLFPPSHFCLDNLGIIAPSPPPRPHPPPPGSAGGRRLDAAIPAGRAVRRPPPSSRPMHAHTCRRYCRRAGGRRRRRRRGHAAQR